MSLDAADAIRAANDLLATIGDEAVLAWWRVPTPTLVLGRGDRRTAEAEVTEVPVVRRSSGGGPVLWGPHLLAFDVILPRSHPRWTADITSAYEWLGVALADALRDLGLSARAIPPDEAHDRNDPDLAGVSCFGGLSPWEVEVTGRKVVGLSQIRRRAGQILQVGILARPETPPLAQVLGMDADTATRLAARTTTLQDEGITDLDAARTVIDRHVMARLTSD